ncbi:MAG: hypothetical protein Q9163_005781 [Psora crenata]
MSRYLTSSLHFELKNSAGLTHASPTPLERASTRFDFSTLQQGPNPSPVLNSPWTNLTVTFPGRETIPIFLTRLSISIETSAVVIPNRFILDSILNCALEQAMRRPPQQPVIYWIPISPTKVAYLVLTAFDHERSFLWRDVVHVLLWGLDPWVRRNVPYDLHSFPTFKFNVSDIIERRIIGVGEVRLETPPLSDRSGGGEM